jgi:predicted DNA-binding protein (MmcQ/YjbR family)
MSPASKSVYKRFRGICLGLPETSEVFVETWGHPTFRVGSKQKMFASCSAPDAERPSLGMKVDRAHQQALIHTDARFTVAAHVGKYSWINMDASGPIDWARSVNSWSRATGSTRHRGWPEASTERGHTRA